MVKPGCVVVLVHGIGDQKEDWSKDFRKALKAALGASSAKVKVEDAYWAPLSTIRELVRPSLAATPKSRGAAFEADVRKQAMHQISMVLEADIPARFRSLSPGNIIDKIKSMIGSGGEVFEDIGNYVSRNGVRTAVQNVVHSRLADAERLNIPALLVAHSQGTVICYDVLRQAGGSYPHLRTWITMGSPLRKFYFSGLQWGKRQLGMPSNLRWVNIYDPKDFVGKDLKGSVNWLAPVPEDHKVDNEHDAGDAHSHWQNPAVVKIIAAEIRKLLT